jgi:hypothetical protein
MTTAFPRKSGRCRRGSTTQRFIQFQQRPFIQRDQAAPRRVDVRNQRDDNGDENWKNESLKNRVSPGRSRLVTDQPQPATGHAQQQQPDSPRHVVAFGCDALPLQINGFIEAADETGGDRRRPLRRSGDRFSPQTVLELGGAFAQRCKSLRKLRLTMCLDAQWYILSKQLHNVGSVRLRQQPPPGAQSCR